MPVFKANHTEPDILSGFFFVGKRFFIVSPPFVFGCQFGESYPFAVFLFQPKILSL